MSHFDVERGAVLFLLAACTRDAVNAAPETGAIATTVVQPSATATATAVHKSMGDARTDCAEASKEQKFLETHQSCTVDADCTLATTWLYPCGMHVQTSAVPDLDALDHSVSAACTHRGFDAPERACTHAVLKAACGRGACGNVVPFPEPTAWR